jgi:hypothetical protein
LSLSSLIVICPTNIFNSGLVHCYFLLCFVIFLLRVHFHSVGFIFLFWIKCFFYSYEVFLWYLFISILLDYFFIVSNNFS